MRPIFLRIKNSIGIRHGIGRDEITIDFEKLKPGVIGLIGETGSGKTTVMNSMTPYRRFPDRDDSLYNHFYGADGVKEFVFEIDDHIYKSVVLIDADHKTMKAYMYDITNGEEKVLNDKLDDYDIVVDEILGSYDVFINSVYSPQSSSQILMMKDSELKSMFIDLFGLNKYVDIIIPIIKNKLNTIDGKISGKRILIDSYESELKKIESIKSEIDYINKSIPDIDRNIIDIDLALIKIDNTISDLTDKLKNTELSRQSITSHNQELTYLNNHINELDSIFKNRGEDIDKQQRTTKKEIQQFEKNKIELSEKLVRFNKLIDNKSLIITKSKRISDIEKQREELLKKINDADKYTHKADELRTALEKLRSSILIKKQQVEGHLKNASLLKEVPCSGLDIENSCKLLSNARDSRGKIDSINELIVSEMADAESLSSQYSDMVKLADAREEMSILSDISKELQDLKNEKWDALSVELPIAEQFIIESDAQFKNIDSEILLRNQILADLEIRKESIVGDYKNALDKDNARVAEILAIVKAEYEKIDSDGVADSIKNAKADRSNINNELIKVQSQRSSMLTKRDMLAQELKSAEEKEEKSVLLRSEIEQELFDYAEYKDIEKVSKKIMVAELISASAKVTDHVNNLLGGAFDYDLTLKIISSMEKSGDKGIKDVFKIIVYNDGESVLGKYLSGGQKAIVDSAIRMAIEMTLSEMSGHKFKTSFWDESDSKLDTDRALKNFQMLQTAHEKSNKFYTFLITHRTEVINAMNQKIYMNEI